MRKRSKIARKKPGVPGKKPRPRAFKQLSVYVPIYIFDMVERLAHETMRPRSRFVLTALLNEIERDKPFDLGLKVPDSVPEHHYNLEAARLSEWLEAFPKGLDLHLIISSRHDYGVPSKDDALCAMRELLDSGQVLKYIDDELVWPHYVVRKEAVKSKTRFGWLDDGTPTRNVRRPKEEDIKELLDKARSDEDE